MKEKCKNCQYKTNCEIILYMIPPCECKIERVFRSDILEPIKYRYQNAITGKWDDEPIDPYYLDNPFMWHYYNE